MRGWLETFERATLDRIPRDQRELFIQEVEDLLREEVCDSRRKLDRSLRPSALPRDRSLTTNHQPPTTHSPSGQHHPFPGRRRARRSCDGPTGNEGAASAVRRRRHHRRESAGHRPRVFVHHAAADRVPAAPSRSHAHRCRSSGALALVLVAAYWFFPSVRKMRLSGAHAVLAAHCHCACEPPRARQLEQLRRPSVLSVRQQLVFRRFGIHPGAIAVARLRRCCGVEWPKSARRGWPSRCRCWSCLPRPRPTGAIPLEAAAALAIAGGAVCLDRASLSPHSERLRRSPCASLIACRASGDVASRPRRRCGCVAARVARADRRCHPDAESIVAAVLGGDCDRDARDRRRVRALAGHVVARAGDGKRPTDVRVSSGSSAPRDDPSHGRRTICAARRQASVASAAARRSAKRDCWVRAWLRFGRAPVIEGGSIFDLRFCGRIGQEFSHMRLERREGCPANVPGWSMPRADLLRR